MTTTLENQLSFGVHGSRPTVDIPDSEKAGVVVESPRPNSKVEDKKLPEGWVNTSQGDVFISPGGVAWVIEQHGDALVSVPVKLLPSDIIKAPAVDRVKRNLADRQRRKSRVVDVSPSILTVGVVNKANSEVLT